MLGAGDIPSHGHAVKPNKRSERQSVSEGEPWDNAEVSCGLGKTVDLYEVMRIENDAFR